MKLTKKEKLAVRRLLDAGQILSNVSFNLGQVLQGDNAEICKGVYRKWDMAYSEAQSVLRKLQLPPF